MNKIDLLESLANLEHEQWVKWSKEIVIKEMSLSEERIRRWKKYWVSYNELDEDIKEFDREYARKIIKLLENKGITFGDIK